MAKNVDCTCEKGILNIETDQNNRVKFIHSRF